MTDYLPYVFGISSLFLGITILLLSFGFYKGKNKTEEQTEKRDIFYSKYGVLIRICGFILIFEGCSNLFFPDPNRYVIGVGKVVLDKNEKKDEDDKIWGTKDREILVKKCIKESGPNGIRYPGIIRDYCECSIDNIMIAMSKEEYLESLQKTIEEQTKEQLPLFQSCYDDMSIKLDSLNNQVTK
jgi:hypothetical protein